MNFQEEVKQLIDLQTEGDYWDYKEFWYDNKASLLHDIICMANNLANRDAYIIIGVSDSKSPDGVRIKGIAEENRKDQQHLIDFLRNKNFAGGIRPTVYLQTLMLGDNVGRSVPVDVIIIKNSLNTPFYLTENFRDKDKELRAGYIYKRVGDTNTAVDSMADVDKVEYLWRKHFGIDLTAAKKLLLLLSSPDEWTGDINNGNCMYHSIYPEFQIRISDTNDDFSNNSIVQNISELNPDTSFTVRKVNIVYHSTIIYKGNVLYLDGFRHLIPFPETDTVYKNGNTFLNESLTYLYFNESQISGKLFNCFAKAEKNWYCEKWDLEPGVGFLQFVDNSDIEEFNRFVDLNMDTLLLEYSEALKKKGYSNIPAQQEYFNDGWSKANMIKARYIYEEYKQIPHNNIADYLMEISSE